MNGTNLVTFIDCLEIIRDKTSKASYVGCHNTKFQLLNCLSILRYHITWQKYCY